MAKIKYSIRAKVSGLTHSIHGVMVKEKWYETNQEEFDSTPSNDRFLETKSSQSAKSGKEEKKEKGGK